MEPIGPSRSPISWAIAWGVILVLLLLAFWALEDGPTPPKPTSTVPSTSTTVEPTTIAPRTSTTEPQDDSAQGAAPGPRGPDFRVSRSEARPGRPAVVSVPSGQVGPRRIGSSAYCLSGIMANGSRVHDGAVASVVLPLGSRWRVVSSDRLSGRSLVGRTFTVEDTGGPRATFDVWVRSCSTAMAMGRPVLGIERA